VKLDEEMGKYASLDEENGFGSPKILQFAGRLVKGASTLCTPTETTKKYNLTAAQCFRLPHPNDWSKWFAISTPPLFVLPVCQKSK
jgi:hypothetical protein